VALPSENSEAHLVPSAGPRLAPPEFDSVFETSSRFVWRVLARLGVARADIQDVGQEVFMVVHRRLQDYDGRASLQSWIYGICVRTASQHRRRHPGRRETEAAILLERGVPCHQERDLEHMRAQRLLQATVDAMDQDQAAVFVLYELEELSMSEVSSALGCPLQTAYSRLYAARKAVVLAFQHREDPRRQP